jgi:transporter family protein
MPVLFGATACGAAVFVGGALLTGHLLEFASCSVTEWLLVAAKSLLVAASWVCEYYALRELPISIASPIRASAPLWVFIGGVFLFREIPTFWQAAGMLSIFGGYYFFSLIGKLEGISFRSHRGIHLIMIGTLLGALSALYDKYLLGVLHIPRNTVQLWFSVDLVLILGLVYRLRGRFFSGGRPFHWRWTIAATGILLIAADYLYFYAVSLPDTQISILSLVRRCNCIVAFSLGCLYFRDANVKPKAKALALILFGIILLALAK